MKKMPCSITDDVMSDPEYAAPHAIEMTRLEEIDLRLSSMSAKINNVMQQVDESHLGLRRELAGVQNQIFLTQIDLADLDK
jgi:hypothetical protein